MKTKDWRLKIDTKNIFIGAFIFLILVKSVTKAFYTAELYQLLQNILIISLFFSGFLVLFGFYLTYYQTKYN